MSTRSSRTHGTNAIDLVRTVAIPCHLAQAVRPARAHREIIAPALTRRTGLSSAPLSKHEPGHVLPSVVTLCRQELQTTTLAGDIRWERLTPESNELELCRVVFSVGAETCPENSLLRHAGKEYGYLVDGQLGLRVGARDFRLEPGDSLVIDEDVPHRLWTLGDTPATAIWMVLKQRLDNL